MEPDSYEIKRQIGIVMQNVAVFNELTVYENIDYFCGLYVADKRERKKLVEETAEKALRRTSAEAEYCLRHCP